MCRKGRFPNFKKQSFIQIEKKQHIALVEKRIIQAFYCLRYLCPGYPISNIQNLV